MTPAGMLGGHKEAALSTHAAPPYRFEAKEKATVHRAASKELDESAPSQTFAELRTNNPPKTPPPPPTDAALSDSKNDFFASRTGSPPAAAATWWTDSRICP